VATLKVLTSVPTRYPEQPPTADGAMKPEKHLQEGKEENAFFSLKKW